MAYTTVKELFKAICDAIRIKDGTTADINHQDIPDRISAITTGDGGIDTTISSNSATATDILSGKKAWVNNKLVTGTHVCEVSEGGTDISDASTVSANQVANGVTVYGSNGKVTGTHTCESIVSVEQATPTISISSSGLITASVTQEEGHVLSGTKTATTQLTTIGTTTVTPGTSSQVVASSGNYTTGDITVDGDSNLISSNIKNGISIFGVFGNYEGADSTSIEATDLSGLYVWEKIDSTGNYDLIKTEVTDVLISLYLKTSTSTNDYDTVYYSDSITYNDGILALVDQSSVVVNSQDTADSLLGKYIRISEKYYEIPTSSVMTRNATTNTVATNISFYCDTAYELSTKISGTTVGYVVGTNSTEYPNNGEQNGYYYSQIGTVSVT